MRLNVEISYKELCAEMGEKPVNGGTNRSRQMKRFFKRVDIEKIGRGKYIILTDKPTNEFATNKTFIKEMEIFCERRHVKIIEGLNRNSKKCSKIKYECNFHKGKVIETTFNSLLRGIGCPYCHYPMSRFEVMLHLGIEDSVHRAKIDGIEYDVYLPKEKIAIEYNGLPYHNIENKEEQDRRKLKQETAEKNGIKLININETENGKEIIHVSDTELIVPIYTNATKQTKKKIIESIQQYLPYQHSPDLWDKAADFMREWKYRKHLERIENNVPKAINQYSKDGKLIRTFNSFLEIKKEIVSGNAFGFNWELIDMD